VSRTKGKERKHTNKVQTQGNVEHPNNNYNINRPVTELALPLYK
jgi:hypothetical protein